VSVDRRVANLLAKPERQHDEHCNAECPTLKGIEKMVKIETLPTMCQKTIGANGTAVRQTISFSGPRKLSFNIDVVMARPVGLLRYQC
jgi:hypothetical protein